MKRTIFYFNEIYSSKIIIDSLIRLSNYIYINVEAERENQHHSIIRLAATNCTREEGEKDSQSLKKSQTQTQSRK